MWDQREIRDRVGGAEALLAELESWRDSPGGAAGLAAVRELVDLYGEALARVLRRVRHGNPDLVRELVDDELVGHLLLVHDLHPLDVSERVRTALEQVPAPHATAELVSVDGGQARVRVTASGCGSSSQGLRESVELAVRAAAPEIDTVEVDVVGAAAAPAFVPLDAVRGR